MRQLLRLLLLAIPAIAFGQPAPPLREVLYAMPKGGDLHHHLSGSVYAETFLELADSDGLCVDKRELAIVECPAAPADQIAPAGTALKDPALYSAMLNSMSMRQFRPVAESGHAHFFNAFEKFRAVSRRHVPQMLTEVVSRFAAENVDYLETIFSPD